MNYLAEVMIQRQRLITCNTMLLHTVQHNTL